MQRRGAPHAPCFCQLRAVSHPPWLLGVMGRRVQCVGDSPTTRRQYWASQEPWPIAQGLARLDPDPGFPEEVRRQELMAGARRPRPTRPTARSGGWGVWRPGRFQLRPVSRDAEALALGASCSFSRRSSWSISSASGARHLLGIRLLQERAPLCDFFLRPRYREAHPFSTPFNSSNISSCRFPMNPRKAGSSCRLQGSFRPAGCPRPVARCTCRAGAFRVAAAVCYHGPF